MFAIAHGFPLTGTGVVVMIVFGIGFLIYKWFNPKP
jgi:hypothetical protein